jgi:hypothetical protein
MSWRPYFHKLWDQEACNSKHRLRWGLCSFNGQVHFGQWTKSGNFFSFSVHHFNESDISLPFPSLSSFLSITNPVEQCRGTDRGVPCTNGKESFLHHGEAQVVWPESAWSLSCRDCLIGSIFQHPQVKKNCPKSLTYSYRMCRRTLQWIMGQGEACEFFSSIWIYNANATSFCFDNEPTDTGGEILCFEWIHRYFLLLQ